MHCTVSTVLFCAYGFVHARYGALSPQELRPVGVLYWLLLLRYGLHVHWLLSAGLSARSGFQMRRAGSHVGTMFGAGAYFGEMSSKGDEYASADESVADSFGVKTAFRALPVAQPFCTYYVLHRNTACHGTVFGPAFADSGPRGA